MTYDFDPTALTPQQDDVSFPALIESQPVQSFREDELILESTLSVLADTSFGKSQAEIDPNYFTRTAESFKEMMKRGDKELMLQQIAEKQQQKALENIQTSITDTVAAGDSPQNLERLNSLFFLESTLKGEEADNPYVREEEVTKTIVDSAENDPTQSAVIQELEQIPADRIPELGILGQIEEDTTKQLIMSQMVEEARLDLEGNNLFENIVDVGTAFIFTAGLAEARTDVPIRPDDAQSVFNKGKNIRLLSGQVFNKMTIPETREFAKRFRETGKKNSGYFLRNELREYLSANKLLRNTERDDFAENTYMGMDAIFGFGLPAAAGTASYLRAAKQLKNIKMANKAAASKIARGQLEKQGEVAPSKGGQLTDMFSERDAWNESLPGIETVDLAKSGKYSNSVMNDVEEMSMLRQKTLGSIRFAKRLTPDEVQVAIDQTRRHFIKRLGANRIEDFQSVRSEVDRNLINLTAKVGKQNGGGYATKAGAKRLAESRKLNNFELVQDEVSSQWFVHTKVDLDASGAIKGRSIKELANISLPRFLLAGNRNVLSEDLFTNARVAELAKVALQADVIAPLTKKITRLSGNSRKAVNNMMVRSEEKQQWLDGLTFDSEFQNIHKRLPTDKERVAYYAAKELNDIDYLLRNRAERIQMSEIDGLTEVSVEAPFLIEGVKPQPGRFMQTKQQMNTLTGKTAYNATTGETLVPTQMTTGTLGSLVDEGYEAVRLREMLEIDGNFHRVILAKKGSIGTNPLPPFVVNYRPGGHRLYSAKYWIKQANFVENTNGTKILTRPLVHANAMTLKEAQEYAAGMNRGLDVYKRFVDEGDELFGDAAQATRLLEDTPFALKGDPIEIIEDMLGGGNPNRAALNLETKVEAVFDRADPQEMRQLLQGNIMSFGDELDTNGVSGWYDTHGRAYFSKKGERMMNTQEQPAELLDPFESMARGLNNAINHSVGVDLRIGEVKRWVKEVESFDGFINNQQLEGLSDMQKFVIGDVGQNVSNLDNLKLRRNIALKREKLRDLLNLETTEAQKVKAIARNLAEAVEGKPIVGKKLQQSFLNLQDKNPVAAMRSFAFDTKLGYFSPAQFFLQIQTSFAIASLDPIGAAGHMGRAMAIRTALINGNESMVKQLGKATQLTGVSPEEFASMVKVAKDTRIATVGNELALLDNFNNSMGADFFSSVANNYRRFRDAGRFVFFESERWNRLAAFNLAWKRMKKQFPDVDVQKLTPEQIDWLVLKTDDFSMNMTTAGTAFWQRGALSVPAQFRGYPARMLEALLPEKAGGSKAFTNSDKLKLAIGQTVLYGSMGLPMVDYISEQYFRNTREEMNPAVYTMMTKGLWDSLVFSLTDGEVATDFAGRAGTSRFIGDIYRDLTEKGILEFALGPSGAIAGDALSSFVSVGRVAVAGGVPSANLIKANVKQFLKNIETVDDATKALMVYNYGQVLNRRGDIVDVAENWRLLSAILTEAGFPAAKLNEVYEMNKAVSLSQKKVKSLVDQLMMPVIRQAFEKPETYEQAYADLQALAAGMLGGTADPATQDLIWKEINSRLTQDNAWWDAISRHNAVRGDSTLTNTLLRQERKELLGENEDGN